MPEYRIFFIGKDGHISTPAKIVPAKDDEAVVRLARDYVDGHDIEIWHEERCVALLKSQE